jgi:maltose alpha-D-glucosyltransferase/alpha-amylase
MKLWELTRTEPPPLAEEMLGAYLQAAELLGRRSAELHVGLASHPDDPAFAPEPFSQLYQRSLYQSMRTQARRNLALLRKLLSQLPPEVQLLAENVLAAEGEILNRFHQLLDRKITAQRFRCHGDFHMGQVLYTGKDFVIIDFEGEPERPISERRIKASPLRDVAGMIRSFHYASHAALAGITPGLFAHREALISPEEWLQFWCTWSTAAFLQAYLNEAERGSFLPASEEELAKLLDAYVMEKSLYELGYELNNRPHWVRIPLEGILQLLK